MLSGNDFSGYFTACGENTDAQAAGQPNGDRDGHGSCLEEIFRSQNCGAVAETSPATDRVHDNPK